jgi:hypothetical protein
LPARQAIHLLRHEESGFLVAGMYRRIDQPVQVPWSTFQQGHSNQSITVFGFNTEHFEGFEAVGLTGCSHNSPFEAVSKIADRPADA